MDSNLLKEAIADAKAVRATALANAKVALEEAFAPRFHAMFADKLKEEASTVTEPPLAEEATVSEQEIDSLIKELEAEVGGEEDAMSAPDAPSFGGDEPPVDMAPETDPAAGEGAPLVAGQTVKLVAVPDAAGAGAPPVPPVPP